MNTKQVCLFLVSGLLLLSLAASARADVVYVVTDDAYSQSTGSSNATGDILYLKRDGSAGSTSHRKVWLQFDTTDIGAAIAARSGRPGIARLDLPFINTSLGSPQGSTWSFQVYGLTDETLDGWTEATFPGYATAPGNDVTDGNTVDVTKTTSVGTFTGVNQAVGTHSVSGAALEGFLASDTNGQVSLIVVRDTPAAGSESYVHGIRSQNSATDPPAVLRLVETHNALSTKGEFETSVGAFTTSGWTNAGAAVEHDGLIAGSHKAAFMDSSVNADMYTSAGGVSGDFLVDYYFATGDGTSGDRGLNFVSTFSGGMINLRVTGSGAVQIYNNQSYSGGSTGWQTLTTLDGVVEFSEDNDADLGFDGATDVLNVHRMMLLAHDWGTATPTYDVRLSLAGSSEFTEIASGLKFFQNGVPNSTAASVLSTIRFQTSLGTINYAVDSVYVAQVPEPSTLALLTGVLLGGWFWWRRRRS